MPVSKPDHPDFPPVTTDLSVVIVSYKCPDHLLRCIQSVKDTVKKIRYEIIVIDNRSGDGTPDAVRSKHPDLRVIENTRNLGFARANNQGVLISQGKFVLLLNNDTEALPGAIDMLVAIMDRSPKVGLLGGRLLNPDRTIQQSFGSRLGPWTQFGQRLLVNPLYQNSGNPMARSLLRRWHSREKDVDWIRGACMLLRKEALCEAGLMDENFFMYLEDVDLGIRIKQAGWKVRFTPEASVVHHEGASVAENILSSAMAYRQSQLYFYQKHYGRWGLSGLKIFLFCKFFKNLMISRLVNNFSSKPEHSKDPEHSEQFHREVLNLIKDFQ